MKLHNIVVSVLVVSMIILGAVDYVTDLGGNYGTTADLSGMDNTRARLEKQQNLSRDLNEDITSFKLENPVDFFAIPYKMIKIGWKILKTVFGSWVTVETIAQEVTSNVTQLGIPIPDWLMPSLIAILVIILISIIAYGFFKWKFED